MSTTGTDVISRLNSRFDDASNSKFTQAVKVDAINAAINTSFPIIKTVAVDSSITIGGSTYEYTPTATPDVAFGFAQAYCTVPSNPKVLLRRVAQRREGNTFKIILPLDLASEFSGETLHLAYNGRTAEIANTSGGLAGTIYLPMEFVEAYASFYLCAIMGLKAAQFEVSPYAQMMKMFEEQAERYKQANRSGQMAQMIPMVAERGAGDVDLGVYSNNNNRYGQSIVLNP